MMTFQLPGNNEQADTDCRPILIRIAAFRIFASVRWTYIRDDHFSAVVDDHGLTLSPGLRLESSPLSLAVKTMVIPGMSGCLISPCLMVTLPLSRSTFLISPSVSDAC